MKDVPGAKVSSLARCLSRGRWDISEHPINIAGILTLSALRMQRPDGPDNMDVDSPTQQRTSRKHLRSSDDEDDLDWSSDVSGRFDDAEEQDLDDYKSPSAKGVKRGRLNDWPLPDEAADYGHHDREKPRKASGNATLGVSYKVSPRVSPRTSATSLRSKHKAASSNSPRHPLGRRSRFVEGNMNDSVSERPPSIFTHERKQQPMVQHRQSGIFRFGKAIASAFNPFGGWGKSSTEHTKESPQKDALTQAEEAYAELKKAGFKGTNKGNYLQDQHVNPEIADETWKAIQEKMGYGSASRNPTYHCGNQEDQPTPSRSPSKASKRSSFQDLRKTKSLGLPFIKGHEPSTALASPIPERISEESDHNGVRRQKSRKELSRQSKLLKKVSNLEDKLDRARRELRDLTGNEERLPAPTPKAKPMSLDMDPGSYPRKFVPGALPTLPSERLLNQQEEAIEGPDGTVLTSVEGRSSVPLEESLPARSPSVAKSPKWRSRESRPSSGKESSSRKRKSPIPEPVTSGKPPQPNPADCVDDRPSEREQLIDIGLLSPPRQAKWQKFEAGDSPGSVERKKSLEPGAAITTQEGTAMHKRSPYLQSRRSSPGLNRSPNSKVVRSPPPLRMRQGRSNLRSISPSDIALLDPNPQPVSWSSPPPLPTESQQGFYLQQYRQLDPDRAPQSSPVRPSLGRKRSSRSSLRDEDIPPVPPLPKELLKDAAKVTKSPTKQSLAKDRASALPSPRASAVPSELVSGLEEFLWPEDVF